MVGGPHLRIRIVHDHQVVGRPRLELDRTQRPVGQKPGPVMCGDHHGYLGHRSLGPSGRNSRPCLGPGTIAGPSIAWNGGGLQGKLDGHHGIRENDTPFRRRFVRVQGVLVRYSGHVCALDAPVLEVAAAPGSNRIFQGPDATRLRPRQAWVRRYSRRAMFRCPDGQLPATCTGAPRRSPTGHPAFS